MGVRVAMMCSVAGTVTMTRACASRGIRGIVCLSIARLIHHLSASTSTGLVRPRPRFSPSDAATSAPYALVLRPEVQLSSARLLLGDAELRLCGVGFPVRDKGSRPERDDVDAERRLRHHCTDGVSPECSSILRQHALALHRPTAAS